jgi:aminoglycoside N3'-acetyltransferase
MSASPLTQETLESGLHQLGLRRGMAVDVHSSLSSFGPVAGGAAAIIAALMAAVGPEGTLVMSAYPVSPAVPLTEAEQARGLTWKVRLLPPDTLEKTGMGRVADEFSRRPDVICGAGLHRVCAWGQAAAWHAQGYQRLLEADGWVLLLGVGIDRCSSMHQAESAGFPPKIAKIFEIPDDIRRDYPSHLWSLGYGSTPGSPWATIWEAVTRRGLVARQTIGQAVCSLFKANAVVGLYKEQLRKNPYALFGMDADK